MGEIRFQLFFSVISNVLNCNFSGWSWILWWRWCFLSFVFRRYCFDFECSRLATREVFWSPTPTQRNILRETYRMIDHDWPLIHKKERIRTWWWVDFSWLTTDSYCWYFKKSCSSPLFLDLFDMYILYNYICIFTIIYIHHHPFIHLCWLNFQPSGHRGRFPPALHLDAPGRADPWRGSPEVFHPNVVEKYNYGPPELKLGVFSPLKNGWLEDDAFPFFFCDFTYFCGGICQFQEV